MKKLLTTISVLALAITVENFNSGFNLSITQKQWLKQKNKQQQETENNHDFTFNSWFKNNKGELFARSDDGLYQYNNDKNTFIKWRVLMDK